MEDDKRMLLERITVNPNICFGKPCIRGHRIWVSLILDMVAGGISFAEIMDNYPGITEEDIRACVAYGAEMTRERRVSVGRYRAEPDPGRRRRS